MSLQQVALADGVRLLEGKRNWWFLGRGGIARPGAGHLTPEGSLRSETEHRLRERGLFSSPPVRSYALTVLTSTHCNPGCGYCFQNTAQDTAGGSRPPRIARARLTSPTITSILGFTERQMADAGLERLRILLFGGEPLLNPRGCLELLERAADIGMTSAGMISNTTLLTPPLARKLSALGPDLVQVTFDGDRADHDRIRVNRADGGGTFDTIVRNIVRAGEAAPLRWTLRGNVSQETFTGSMRSSTGSRDRPTPAAVPCTSRGSVMWVSDTPTTCCTPGSSRSTSPGGSGGHWNSVSPPAAPGARRPCRTCGHTGGRYGAVISADGTLASRWETAGKPDWEVGTVTGGYRPETKTGERWVSCEDLYRFDEDARTLAGFRDSVDAALLDYLDETERL